MQVIDEQVDALTHRTLSHIDKDVYASLTTEQITALRLAAQKGTELESHRVDARFSVPLYLKHIYFVLLMGRDRRKRARTNEFSRRIELKEQSLFMTVYLILSATVPVIFISLYIIKSAMGIDIFPDKHLSDFFW